MTEQQIKKLIQRYLNNLASPEELADLERVLQDARHERLVKGLLDDAYRSIKSKTKNEQAGLAAKERIFQYIISQGQQEVTLNHTKRKWWMVAAASFFLIISAGILYTYKQQSVEQPLAQDEIQPGGNKAYLILADGERISLGDVADGNIVQQQGIMITKTADGELIYQVQDAVADAQTNTYHTMETPNGGQYRVHLPDGTAVWLNAASRLKYPANFTARSERRVELLGEAYFEVAPDKEHPFIVTAGNQEVRVLGTHFNVCAYVDDAMIKTTLLEGRVEVGILGEPISKVLRPGEQAVNAKGALTVSTIHTDYAVAWKNGYFRFNNKTLEMAMNEIARWYDVKVTYEKPELKKEELAGTISKYSSIEQVLEKMELTGAFHFSVKNKEIVVE